MLCWGKGTCTSNCSCDMTNSNFLGLSNGQIGFDSYDECGQAVPPSVDDDPDVAQGYMVLATVTLIAILIGTSAQAVSAGAAHTCSILWLNRRLKCWGLDMHGQASPLAPLSTLIETYRHLSTPA